MSQENLNNQQQLQTFGDISAEGNAQVIISQISTTYQIISRDEIKERKLNAASPFIGLRKFEARDKDLFFGRDRYIANLIQVISKDNLILLEGSSGSGKSSLIRAGLIPKLTALLRTRLVDLVFTPDRDPFESLRSSLHSKGYSQIDTAAVLQRQADGLLQVINALKQPTEQWLIFIDQFEELFTRCKDVQLQNCFIDGLTTLANEPSGSVKVLLAMRADFLPLLGPYPSLTSYRLFLHDMQPDELQLAIEQPAAQHGVVFEDGLVKSIIDDVQGQASLQPGSLPLLQYTLDLLWQRSQPSDVNRTLQKDAYYNGGSVRDALQQHMDEIYTEFTLDEKTATKQIFLKLVDINNSTNESETVSKIVSRRASLTEFSELVREVLNKLVDNNLLVTNQQEQPTVELAHEILISSWLTFKEWIEGSQEAIVIRNRLADDAQHWKELLGKNKVKAADELWSGSKLERVLELKQEELFNLHFGGLDPDQQAFIHASAEKRDHEQKKKVKQARRTAIGAMIAASLVAAVAFLANSQRLEAERQRSEAERQQSEAEKQTELAQLREKSSRSLNLLATEPGDALALAIQATGQSLKRFNGEVISPVEYSLSKIVTELRGRNFLFGHKTPVRSLVFSSDGKILASSGTNGVELWDLAGNPVEKPAPGNELIINPITFNPDAKVIGSPTGKINLIHDSKKLTIQFKNDQGNSIFSVEVITSECDVLIGPCPVSFSSNEELVFIGDKLVKRGFGEIGNVRFDKMSNLCSTAFSPNNAIIAVGTCKNVSYPKYASIVLLNYSDLEAKNQQSTVLEEHKDGVSALAFSPDGKALASGSWDRTLRLWELVESVGASSAKAKKELILRQHNGSVQAVAFTPDGKLIASASDDQTIRVWNVNYEPSFIRFLHPGNNSTQNSINRAIENVWASGHYDDAIIHALAFSPDNKLIAIGQGNQVHLWDIDSEGIRQSFTAHDGIVDSLTFSPDGFMLATSGADKTIRLWNLEGKPIGKPFVGHEDFVRSIAFSPDGKKIISGSKDKTLRLWDLQGTPIGQPFRGHEDLVAAVAFSPNGQQIASGSWDKTVRVWNLDGQMVGQPLNSHEGKVTSVGFSPDGQLIASGSKDKTIRLWKLEGNSIHASGQPFKGHEDTVTFLSFSSDGKTIFSNSLDCTVRVWNRDGDLVTPPFQNNCFWQQETALNLMAVSPNGKMVVNTVGWKLYGEYQSSLRLLQLPRWQDWLAQACTRWGDYYIFVTPTTDTAKAATQVCQEFVWNREQSEHVLARQEKFLAQPHN